ncbi:restriction endonuclease [Piscinibacter sakaiensis]|uniref:Restriction endonuclease type IV Mrr domain-containing protein n=1 Tax=Piscinibacter sakaiensis TaxID=1547922 RepID=A0A0K8P3D5_PISS1|nr:restriction endonuclease [Piscinibacter sakaiensis]GAP37162.1 hypothetical protein ISF6_3017 [Piscinibacter sakaiensis]
MPSPSDRPDPRARRRRGWAAKLGALGVGIAAASIASGAALGRARPALLAIGLMLAAAGGLLWWLARRLEEELADSGWDERLLAVPPGLAAGPGAVGEGVASPAADAAGLARRAAAAVHGVTPPDLSVAGLPHVPPPRFLRLVEALYAQAGFEARLDPPTARPGRRLWLHSRHQPGAPVGAVLCVHGLGEPVGPAPLREWRAELDGRGLPRGQCATAGRFTPEAAAYAAAHGLGLLDAAALVALAERRGPAQREALRALARGRALPSDEAGAASAPDAAM